jgi:Hypervirulence associated proteins TUDOR domain
MPQEVRPMASDFKRGDHVEWYSEAGRVRGTIQRKVTKEIVFKGSRRHASEEEPQYIIKSDKTDHLAIHKGSALRRMRRSGRSFRRPGS